MASRGLRAPFAALCLLWLQPSAPLHAGRRLLLPPCVATRGDLAPALLPAAASELPTAHSVALFVHTALAASSRQVLPDTVPSLSLILPSSPLNSTVDEKHRHHELLSSQISEIRDILDTRKDFSKAALVVLFLDSTNIDDQMHVLNQIIFTDRMVDDAARFLFVISSIPSEAETKYIFSHIQDNLLQSSTLTIAWNKSSDKYDMFDLRCRLPVRTITLPKLIYNPQQDRSVFNYYLLHFKDDESKLLKEVLLQNFPNRSFTYCKSGNEEWREEYRRPTFFKKSQSNFGKKFNSRFLYPHLQDDFCFLVRHARRLSLLRSLLLTFPLDVWAMVAVTMLGITMVYYLTMSKKLSNVSVSRLFLFVTAILETLRSLVIGSFVKWPNRLLFLPLLVSATSLILSNVFCGNMSSRFTVPVFEKEINTIEDVSKNVDTFYYNMKDVEPMYILNNPFIAKIKPKLIEDTGFIAELLHNVRTAALLRRSEIQRLVLDSRYAQNGRSHLRQVPQCLYSPAYQSIQVGRNNPYIPKLNSMVLNVVQTGLWKKLEKEALHNYFSNLRRTTLQQVNISSAEKLVLDKFIGLFMILIFSLIVSAMIFLIEIVWHMCIVRKQRKTKR